MGSIGFQMIVLAELAILDFIHTSPVYALEDEVIEQAIHLRQKKNMKLGDAIIAATAVVYDPFRRVSIARARLAACESLQGMVLSAGGHLSKVVEPSRNVFMRLRFASVRLKESRRGGRMRR